jgi:transcription initiation factor IIE alpha subunit
MVGTTMINKLKKHQDQIPYDMLSREVVQSIKNPTALAIWAYLQSQADNWDVVEPHIREHFDIGRTTYLKAMKCLRDAGLYEFVRHKDEHNNFTGGHYNLYPFPQLRKSVLMETKTDIKEEEIVKEEDINKKNTSAVFDRFWKLYPNKVNKKKANISFNRLTKTKQNLAIEDIKTRFVGIDDIKYIPHATTYINGERWEDETQTLNKTEEIKFI